MSCDPLVYPLGRCFGPTVKYPGGGHSPPQFPVPEYGERSDGTEYKSSIYYAVHNLCKHSNLESKNLPCRALTQVADFLDPFWLSHADTDRLFGTIIDGSSQDTVQQVTGEEKRTLTTIRQSSHGPLMKTQTLLVLEWLHGCDGDPLVAQWMPLNLSGSGLICAQSGHAIQRMLLNFSLWVLRSLWYD